MAKSTEVRHARTTAWQRPGGANTPRANVTGRRSSPDIFISYSHRDRERIRPLIDALQAQHWLVYWDDAIRTGQRFDREIDDALSRARCVVVVWSEASVASDWVRSEAQFGLDHGKLMPVTIDNVALPTPFDRVHTIDLSGWPARAGTQAALQRFLDDVSARLRARSATIDMSARVPGFDGRVAIAVLPFEMQGSESGLEYVADGITDDVIVLLQRFRTFPVISRHSSFAYRGRAVDPSQIARDLGVGYLVVGAVRKLDRTMRVSVQLIDARSQHTIWSELYDRSGADVLGLQQEIATEIAARLEPEIESAERRLGQFAPPVKPVVWHLVRRGLWHHYRFTREDAPLARRYFERALMRDPHSVEALVALGWWTFQDCAVRRCAPQEWDALRGYAERALAIDPRDARATTQLGVVHMMQSRHAQARTLFREAININPSYAWAYSHLGSSFYLDGMPEQALIPQRTSIRLSPFDVFVFHAFGELAMALFMLEDWPAAIDATEHSLRLRHGYWLAHVVRVASFAYAQRSADAAFALEELRTSRPEFSQRDVEWLMFTDRKWNARLLDGLRIAGWNPQ